MVKTGIITALRTEAACLGDMQLSPGVPVVLEEGLLLTLSGMGKKAVSTAIDSLLAADVRALVSFGTAAALAGELKPGDVLIPENVLGEKQTRLNLRSPWRDRVLQGMAGAPMRIYQGSLLHSSRPLTLCAEKKAGFEETGALGVDMESGLIAAAALSRQIPVLVLRVVIDNARRELPKAVLQSSNNLGDTHLPTLAGHIIRDPRLVIGLLQLGGDFLQARRSMRWLAGHGDLLRA